MSETASPTPRKPVKPTPPSPAMVPHNNRNDILRPRYQRGDIWFVAENTENPPVGTELWANRPGVIVSNPITSNKAGFVQIIYLTSSTKKRSGPTHIPIGSPISPDKPTMALVEQIHTVDVSRLQRRLGTVDTESMTRINDALALTLALGKSHNGHTLFLKWEEYLKRDGIDIAGEINALIGNTDDERVLALQKVVRHLTEKYNSLESLYESSRKFDKAMGKLEELDLVS